MKIDLLKKKKMNFSKKKLVESLLFCVYVISIFVLISFHENWRDEAQQWFIARDLSFRRNYKSP